MPSRKWQAQIKPTVSKVQKLGKDSGDFLKDTKKRDIQSDEEREQLQRGRKKDRQIDRNRLQDLQAHKRS